MDEQQVVLTSRIELIQNGEVIWSDSSHQEVINGRPVKLNIRSDKLLAITYITVYPEKNSHWVVIAQAEVWYADKALNSSGYYQAAETLSVKEGDNLLFYPFKSNGEPAVDSIQIRLLVNISRQKK